jgi:pimeloyl-ACP methyl ester carboxylesterase
VRTLPQLAGVRHRYLEVNGVRLHLAEAGTGPPLLLLHGWPQHWWCWRRLIPRLAQSYRVLAPDLRGFGWSEAPRGDYSKATFAADILALLDSEGLPQVRIIGHDWGAYAAFLIALERPERVQRLLALDISPPWSGLPRPRNALLPLLAIYQVLLATPLVGRRLLMNGPGLVRSIIRAGSARDARWSTEELDIYGLVLREPDRAAASAACYRTFLIREMPALAAGGDRSGELRVPTLLAMGQRSAIRLALDPRPAGHLRVVTIAQAGHFLPEEAPEKVLALASSWFAESAPAA